MTTYKHQGPAEAEIETPLGKSQLICWGTEARLLPLEGYENGRSRSNARINNVDYHLRVELEKPAAAPWQLSTSPQNPNGYRSISLDRYDLQNYSADGHGTDSARKKVHDVLVPFVAEYLNNHPEMQHNGRDAFLKNEHRRASAEIEVLEEKLADLKAQRNAAQAQILATS